MSTTRRMMMASGRGSAVFDWSGLIDNSLSGDIIIPDGMELVASGKIQGCSGITSIVVPDSVTRLQSSCFRVGSKLRWVDCGSGITQIENMTFYWNTGLEYLIFRSVIPPTVAGSSAFSNTNDCPIYVPDESVEAYKAANNWSELADRIKPLSEFVGGVILDYQLVSECWHSERSAA